VLHAGNDLQLDGGGGTMVDYLVCCVCWDWIAPCLSFEILRS